MANSKNKVKYGLRDVYYAKAAFDDDTGDVTYDELVHIPSAVSLSLDPEGENEPWYADNGIFIVLGSNQGYTGSIEVALLPESFYIDILHEEKDSNGVMAEVSDAEIEHFALTFRFEGDKHKVLHVLHNCTCSRPAMESSTVEDSKEPQTDTLDLTVSPLANGYVKAKTSESTPDSVYNSWFTQVYEPQGTAEDETAEEDTENANG